MLPLAHPSLQPKQDLERFSRFCTAHSRQSLYFTTCRPFSSLKLPLPMRGSEPPSLGESEYSTQTASRSVQPLLHSSRQSVPVLYSGPPFPSKLPLPMGMWTSSNTWFLGPTGVLNPNGILISSAIFAGLTTVTDRQTDRQTDRPCYSVSNRMPQLRT